MKNYFKPFPQNHRWNPGPSTIQIMEDIRPHADNLFIVFLRTIQGHKSTVTQGNFQYLASEVKTNLSKRPERRESYTVLLFSLVCMQT